LGLFRFRSLEGELGQAGLVVTDLDIVALDETSERELGLGDDGSLAERSLAE
jgi:hypothetical protein